MSLWKQLINLDRRIDQVSRAVSPPTLRMVIVDEGKGEEFPEKGTLSEWDLLLIIESKGLYNK